MYGLWMRGWGCGVWNDAPLQPAAGGTYPLIPGDKGAGCRGWCWALRFQSSRSGVEGLQVEVSGCGVDEAEEGRYKPTWKMEFKLPWRKAGPLKSSR